MNFKEIQQLISFISRSGLDEVRIETEEIKLTVKKHGNPSLTVYPTVGNLPTVAPVVLPVSEHKQETVPFSNPSETSVESAPVSNGKTTKEIKSPMIGTFYRSPNPQSEAFVKVGDSVSVGQPVCIIEAMKLFNEIESDISGTIVKILVDDASPVEYDQPLFLVELA